ncbi:hypothetical protein [Flavonifractor plautii]|uniref:hypothetical protein n=1 Tax=Flavonifractor plautii TaxID=292800 RepID=UPI0023314471|nr:hypothetical protein [Flavonifractor plautii]MDB7921751.1 hypothetical protein [Flavonifractor plautii]MDB7945449.1 hypothetical protein [Flavonifractor plautii]
MEINYGAVFDVEVPETTTGAEETEAAEPSENDTTTAAAQGAEEQEAAAPAVEETEESEQPQTEAPEQEPKTDRDAQFAAARRKAEAERDAAIAQAKEDAQKQVDEFFKTSGLMNPYTGQPITTRAEYEAYRERFEADQKAKLMEKAGITQEEFQAFVQGLPEVRAARQAKAEAEAAARQAREQEAKARVDEQLRQIQAIDPTVKELGDLAKLDTYPKLYDMVKRGYSILDAYRLANYDTLTQRAAEASRKAAINSVQSKQHLKATESRGGGAIPIPDSVLEEYRVLNPGATKEEIQKHYQSYMKNSRKEQ